ncbi:MAG: hypothetical protein DRP78_01170 [Candidatus Omnitrophota bacterium]|nr:MAG: hypothetical protein DRP78_01170 [Candidatus Omnitrophota bacterium]
MKKFKFRLEAVLEHKQKMHKQAQVDFFNAKQHLEKGNLELTSIENKEKLQRADLKKSQIGKLNAGQIITHLRYLMHLGNAKQMKKNDLLNIEKDVNKNRQALIAAAKDQRIIEKLKEKKLRSFVKKIIESEQQIMDENAVNGFTRGKAEK